MVLRGLVRASAAPYVRAGKTVQAVVRVRTVDPSLRAAWKVTLRVGLVISASAQYPSTPLPIKFSIVLIWILVFLGWYYLWVIKYRLVLQQQPVILPGVAA